MRIAFATLLCAFAVSGNPFAPTSGRNAKTGHLQRLLRSSKAIRDLNEDYPVDISGYSVQFQKCQFIQAFDDNLAQDEDSATVLGISRFAIFRLCPYSDCDNCSTNYGEYLVDLATYLAYVVEYLEEQQEEMCDACDQWCDQGNNANGQRRLNDQKPYGLDCESCVEDCYYIKNMEDNGFVDAIEFLECEKIYDDGEDDGLAYYAAPICAAGGDKIKIGVFSDENCEVYEPKKYVEDYLEPDDNGQSKGLSHALLQQTYKNTCFSCLEQDGNNNDDNDNNDGDQVVELCENLYNYAGKCEAANGFQHGYYGVQGFENQWEQEDLVCEFIKSIKAGTYDEYGEINISGGSFSISGGSRVTRLQKLAITFFVLGTAALAVYAGMIHSGLSRSKRHHGLN